jgi:ABC-type lipoprotein export system ATPase subunit
MRIELSTNIINDEYTQYVYDVFDIQNSTMSISNIDVDLGSMNDFEWNIGAIIGSSGSGKTTILKQIGNIRSAVFDSSKALISNFDWMSPKDATMVLTSMGLSSVPTWLRSFDTLSNGEQYRATLAYLVASAKQGDIILIDEYTSVVDRDVAKAMSYALQKYIRRENKQIIVASCHHDILEWIMPDWICAPQKGGTLERCDYLRQGRPKIELQVSRVEFKTWDLFKKHHYLTDGVNKSCSFILFEWCGKPIGIVAISPLPSGNFKNSYRLSRTVVLPDYHGMGIGSKISDFCSAIIVADGGRCFTKTVNPALGEYRNNSKQWKTTSKHGRILKYKDEHKIHMWEIKARASYCHEFIGDPIYGYSDLLLPIGDMRHNQLSNLVVKKWFI